MRNKTCFAFSTKPNTYAGRQPALAKTFHNGTKEETSSAFRFYTGKKFPGDLSKVIKRLVVDIRTASMHSTAFTETISGKKLLINI